jgi:hypothetical protein
MNLIQQIEAEEIAKAAKAIPDFRRATRCASA